MDSVARRKRTLCIALTLLLLPLLAALTLMRYSSREPSREGKTLGEWIILGADDSKESLAYQKIQSIGGAAIPCLLDWIQARPSRIKGWLNRFLDQQSAFEYQFKDDSYELQHMALAGFAYLGEAAQAAIPKLWTLIDDSDQGAYALMALLYIGEPAIPTLLAALNHKSPAVRAMVTRTLVDTPHRHHPKVLTKLLELTEDAEAEVKETAVRCLRDANGQPDQVGPALVRIALDPTHPGRLNAQHYLHQWSTNVALTLPVFQAGLRDKNAAVRRCAVDGLAKIRSRPVLELMQEWLSDPDDTVRMIAVASLGRATNEVGEAKPLLERALTDPDSLVRAAAAGAWARLAGQGEESALDTPALASTVAEIKRTIRPEELGLLGRINPETAYALGYPEDEGAELDLPPGPDHGRSLVPERILKERFSALTNRK